MTQSLHVLDTCSSCGSHEFIESDGFTVCRDCGTVDDRVMVPGLFHSQEIENTQSMQSVELGGRVHIANALGSHIGYRRDSESIFRASKILRMKRCQQQAMLRIEQRLQRGLTQINRTSVQLQIPRATRDEAAYLFRKILPHYSVTMNQYLLVFCVLLLAVRMHQLPIREKEIIDVVRLPVNTTTRRPITRTKFFVMKILDIKWPSLRSEIFVPKLISELRKNTCVLERLERKKGSLDYFNKLEVLSTKLLKAITSFDYAGRSPIGLAASAVYSIDSMILHVTTQKTVSESIGVPEYNIRDHVTQLWKKQKYLITKLLEVEE